ncbi:tudor domain-containing protein 3 [Sitodiplosis mosellana]|uniref:tudor domain-containing protein 3 n=1 Tax=Sitodiplosis mosellana TaxID=263140 RepID=UPI0024440804|nr:tudor domain-containing protein 3 [Sitodiplosis mosellana]
MATVLQKLKDEGWFISDDGLKKLNENGLIGDVKELKKRALDHDLRELVINGGLPNDIAKSSKVELPSSGVVLQVVNVRNVSAPKVNQESKTSPRLLQIDLSDGQSVCSGLDLEHLSAFSINVAPGTKVLLRNTVKVIQGFLSLTPQNISILGGQVQTLYEKWETHRTLAKYAGIGGPSSKKSNGDTLKGSPPPWISFGNKIKGANGDDATFKSLKDTTKTKEVSKEESEFLALRNSAIADAATNGEVRKQFGGHNRQLVDHNVKKIMDKGYSEDQAKLALKISRNNLEKAMSGLKKRNDTSDHKRTKLPEATAPERSSRRGGKFDEPPAAKPSGKVSLFDFLSDKIPDVEPPQQKQNTRLPNHQSQSQSQSHDYGGSKSNSQRNASKFENNISSSFASRQKKDESQPSRSKWNNDAPEKQGNKPTFQQYQSSPHQQQQSSYKSTQSNNQTYQNPNHNYQQNNAKNSRYSAPQNNPSQSDSHHSYSNDMNNKRTPNDRKPLPNSNVPSNAKPKANMKSLIDATANLQIGNDNKSHKANQGQAPPSQQQQHHHQQQQQQRNTNFEEMFPHAKQFPYNPYKIMGFQNKETNEFAMNVLKMGDQKSSKAGNNNTGSGASGGGGGGGGGGNVFVNNNNLNTAPIPNTQPNLKHAHIPNQQIPLVPVQQNIPAPKPTYINPNVAQFTLPAMPQPPPQQFLWSFKVGDRCLAKYWEDEKYYNAEIQAVTDKTCVVHFPEYGNFEEVLLTDCLPITDANHQPINQYSAMQAPAPIHQIAYAQLPPNKGGPHFHQPPFHQPGHHPPHHSAVLHPPLPTQPNQQQRYRGNRGGQGVYVPPAQRK